MKLPNKLGVVCLITFSVCSFSYVYNYMGHLVIKKSNNHINSEWRFLENTNQSLKYQQSPEVDTQEIIVEKYDNHQLSEAWSRVPVFDTPHLPRLLTQFQLNSSLTLLSTLVRFFNDYNIEYMMLYGTLLGSYVSHSILTWDDDMDLVINVRHQKLLEELSSNGTLDDYQMGHLDQCIKFNKDKEICEHVRNKLWLKTSPWTLGRNHLLPFVDVITYVSNDTHVLILNSKRCLVFPREAVYPLQKRPLNGMWLYAPREPYAFLAANYVDWEKRLESKPKFTCSWPRWNHWAGTGFRNWRKVDCDSLLSFYPFVHRTKNQSGEVQEELVLNNVTYYSIITIETFQPEWQRESHKLQWTEYWASKFMSC